MKRLLNLFIGAAVLVALSGSSLVWGKAHVPFGLGQVCTDAGEVRNVKLKDLKKRGACRLPVCVFNESDGAGGIATQFVFLPKGACTPVDANGDGFCDTPGTPAIAAGLGLSAIGITAACTEEF